ncbi:MAG: hypothetical protein KJ667_01715 [Alphaproteobacteria bacterium]|nr:hypothetical protein [Alphaproteobacteria bacterium]
MDPISMLLPMMGGLLGGGKSGDINVSQSASNTTGISLSNVFTGGPSSAPISTPITSNTSPSNTSGAGVPANLNPSPVSWPILGGTATEEGVMASTGQGPIPVQMLLVGAAGLAGAVLLFAGRKKRRKGA